MPAPLTPVRLLAGLLACAALVALAMVAVPPLAEGIERRQREARAAEAAYQRALAQVEPPAITRIALYGNCNFLHWARGRAEVCAEADLTHPAQTPIARVHVPGQRPAEIELGSHRRSLTEPLTVDGVLTDPDLHDYMRSHFGERLTVSVRACVPRGCTSDEAVVEIVE